MDKKTLVKKLTNVFSDISLKDKKYAEVWLSEMDFGGMYNNGTYILHIKPEPKAESHIQEISDVVDVLDRDAKDTLAKIWSIKIHMNDEPIYRQWDDITVYDEEMAVK